MDSWQPDPQPHHPLTELPPPPSQPAEPGEDVPFPERRASWIDRRGQARNGKYERRRNRCGVCVFYVSERVFAEGFCEKHQIPMLAETYACPHFNEQPPAKS